MIVAGIMSGTSLDGIDVAIVDIGRRIRPLAWSTTPYPAKVRAAILAVSNRPCHTAQISRLNFLLPALYAKALKRLYHRTRLKPAIIGCHGQTIYHDEVSTLQIGDGSVLAELMGIPVVSDFRPRDIAAGGKGAPLVPYLDYLLFRHRKRTRVAVNIGGIANITVIPPAARPEQVIAFDTGPGNMVIDQLVARLTNGRQTYDRDGRTAAHGRIHKPTLARLLRHPYFRRQPPKTAGREQFGEEFVQSMLDAGQPLPDLIATATALTAITIARAIRPASGDVIAGGGGAHNRTLMSMLASHLPGCRIQTTAEYGIDPDAKEAVAFAVLAHATWRRKPGNLPSATGARNPVVLGQISSVLK